ncbi:MAG: fimbrial protein [Serratia marcescens]|nr:fimbrial protein [Serratia marcescens]EJC6395435.1 fimbrial protein [Serratia marcescens]MDU7466732.1 fimbrial protein [Serratia marcescens]HEJ7007221.1 fimbrial protein [Serratia marcescens]
MTQKWIVRMGSCMLVLMLWVSKLPAEAAENMRFYGTLIAPPPCQINDGRVIEVNFGDDLLTTKIDGVNYRKSIDYTLDCSAAGSNAIRMQIQGAGAWFDGSVLATVERRDLGIAIKVGSSDFPLSINSWVALSSNSTKPALAAVPVKASGSQLDSGRFSAGATLLFEYQ